jgi:VIT1/CCC1 family predicted Fe2+/Mn2+ transporter|tara:strand:+ start:537 stop:740 length:204 start_codon:yes stop_codon:yes gene_type:complete
MNDNLKLILVVLITFISAFLTSLLLELPLFKNPVRYVLAILLILVELYFGYIVYKYIYLYKKGNKVT